MCWKMHVCIFMKRRLQHRTNCSEINSLVLCQVKEAMYTVVNKLFEITCPEMIKRVCAVYQRRKLDRYLLLNDIIHLKIDDL